MKIVTEPSSENWFSHNMQALQFKCWTRKLSNLATFSNIGQQQPASHTLGFGANFTWLSPQQTFVLYWNPTAVQFQPTLHTHFVLRSNHITLGWKRQSSQRAMLYELKILNNHWLLISSNSTHTICIDENLLLALHWSTWQVFKIVLWKMKKGSLVLQFLNKLLFLSCILSYVLHHTRL